MGSASRDSAATESRGRKMVRDSLTGKTPFNRRHSRSRSRSKISKKRSRSKKSKKSLPIGTKPSATEATLEVLEFQMPEHLEVPGSAVPVSDCEPAPMRTPSKEEEFHCVGT